MITAIEIENFKAIGERVRVELKPLTLIFGPNSAGKSTIIQALHCAREIFERHNLDPDRTVSGGAAFDLGGFWNIVHRDDNRDAKRLLHLRIDVDTDSLPDYEFDQLGHKPHPYAGEWSDVIDSAFDRCRSAWAEVKLSWMEPIGPALVLSYRVGINGEQIALTMVNANLDGSEIRYVNLDHPILNEESCPLRDLFGDSEFARQKKLAVPFGLEKHRPDWPSALPAWDKVLAVHPEGSDYFPMLFALSRMIVGPGEAIRDELRRFRYLGPIREMPARNYVPPRHPDEQRWATGLGAWDRLHESDQDFIRRVNHWLSRLKCGYGVRLKEYRETDWSTIPTGDVPLEQWNRWREEAERQPLRNRVVLVPDGQSIEVLPNDVGIGISQLLPAVVMALDSDEGITAIEQPEIHLHPKLQAEMGDLFIEAALGEQVGERPRKIFVVETHSEHLILRLLRRMRDTVRGQRGDAPRVRPEDVAVLFVEPTPKGSVVHELRLKPDGSLLDPWPGGFFEETFGEIFG